MSYSDNMVNSIGDRIKYIRSELLKMSRKEVHNKHGLSPDTLAAWENGKINVSENSINRCIDIFNSEEVIVSREWLVTGEGLNPRFHFDLSRYFKNNPAINSDSKEEEDSILLAREVEFFRSLSPNSVTGIISGDNMLPLYAKGDYVGGRLKYNEIIEECVGKDCIIYSQTEEFYIRRLQKNPHTNNYNLASLNPNYGGSSEPVIFDVRVKAVAPIIWHRRIDYGQ